MRLKRGAFTFMEMVFVLAILGIIAKFGVEFLAQAYRNYLHQKITNRLANTSSSAVEFIAKRLQYRIRSSVIVRKQGVNTPIGLEGLSSDNEAYTILEWIGYDIDGFRGDGNTTTKPLWSGVIDKNISLHSGDSYLSSPDTNLTVLNGLIYAQSGNTTTVSDAALFLYNADSDINSSFGWYGGDGNLSEQNLTYAMHPIMLNATIGDDKFAPAASSTFTNLFKNIREKGRWGDSRYKLSWSAYAVEHNTTSGDLVFWYNFQPWQGEKYTDGNSSLIMNHVNTFKMIQVEGVIKIQVCTTNDDMNGTGTMNIGGFALCKEKTIY